MGIYLVEFHYSSMLQSLQYMRENYMHNIKSEIFLMSAPTKFFFTI